VILVILAVLLIGLTLLAAGVTVYLMVEAMREVDDANHTNGRRDDPYR